jgi:hypothetical protein
MVNSATTQANNDWELDWLAPQPAQDSQLLQQLGFLPGLPELLMLRQVHALEHATVWVLSETAPIVGETVSQPDNETLGGLSTNQGFYLYGNVTKLNLERAVRRALQRLQWGEWNLALHPRCGTNLSVSALLTAGLALGAHLLLPRCPIEQLFGLAAATAMAGQIAPDIGMSAQKYLMTAIPFNLELVDISATQDFWGRTAYFVRLAWQDAET